MEIGCEYSRLTIPNDPSYARIAGTYVGEIAVKIGFDHGEKEHIERRMSEALLNIFEYSFEPGERTTCDIICERAPEGLRVAIRDRGLPIDPAQLRVGPDRGSDGKPSGSMPLAPDLGDYWDEVHFNNLGLEGKETVLIKYLKDKSLADFYQTCEIWPFEPKLEPGPPQPEKIEYEVRLMKSSEALEVAKCIYQAYGHTYPYEQLYRPDRIRELNETGQMTSAVAVTADGEIMGHCAFSFMGDNRRIALLGQGAVKPKFRSHGSFWAMSEFLVEMARSQGVIGVFGEAVTVHTVSQQVAHRVGLVDVAQLLGRLPLSVHLRGSGDQTQRMTVLALFMYLRRPSHLRIYPPEHHREMIGKLYKGLGVVPVMDPPWPGETELPRSDSILHVHEQVSQGYAEIELEQFGKETVQDVESARRQLCYHKIDVIDLWLDLTDPLTFRWTEQFEQLGFFFCGILPGGMKNGDALILQYLNNVRIDYDQIAIHSPGGKELLAYVKEHDPNRLG
jgi:anti-sigma regulatory factor (Ser/Thr protein kinase)